MCRMLIAAGEVDIATIIDDFIIMASDKNEKHENNEDRDFPHGDGWSIVYYDNDQLKVDKSIKPCYDDDGIHAYKNTLSPLYVLHARRGSKGKGGVAYENVHPFVHSGYVFCHNGTVEEELAFENKFSPAGKTDSELLFYYLLSGLQGELNESFIHEKYSRIQDYSGMNTIVTNGETSFVVNWYTRKTGYYTYKILKQDNSIIISSEILPHYQNENWEKTNNKDILRLTTSAVNVSKYSSS